MKKFILILFICVANVLPHASGNFDKNKGNKIMPKKTIAIDLDGVLNNYTSYTDDIPEIRKGAVDFIRTLSKEYELILYTNRSSKLATEWLIKNNINNYFIDVTNVKPIAKIYIDDRAINFNGDYNKTLKTIKDFNVYWKKRII